MRLEQLRFTTHLISMKNAAPKSSEMKRPQLGREPEPTSKVLSSKDLHAEDARLRNRVTHELLKLVHFPSDIDDAEKLARSIHAVELFKRIKPADGIEDMLAEQMVGTHQAALACLRRAAMPSQSFEGFNMALKNAQQLMALYTQQLAAFDKHRGKGQQKMTVEHVHIESGGQAVIGHVERNREERRTEPRRIEEGLDIPLKAKAKSTQKQRDES